MNGTHYGFATPLRKLALLFGLPVLIAGVGFSQDEESASELDATVVQGDRPEPRPEPRPQPEPAPEPIPQPEPEPEIEEAPEPEPLRISDEAPVALKMDVPVSELPRSVEVVTQQQFQERGARTVQDALLYTPGVYGETYGFDTRGDWALVRGVDPLAYVNGLRSQFGFYNNTRPHPYALDTVEILKGPASVRFGQGSVGGIVNATYKTADTFRGNEVFTSYGSWDRSETGLDVGGRDGNLSWRLVGLVRDANTQVDHVEDDTWFLLPSITWSPSEDTSFTFLSNHQEAETGTSAQFLPWQGTILPGFGGRRIPTNRFLSEPGLDRYDTRQNAYTAIFEHRFDDVFSLEARANYTEGDADYRSMWPIFTGGGIGRIMPDGTAPRTLYLSDATSEAFVTDVRLRAEFEAGAVSHNAMIGFDYQDAETDNDTLSLYGGGTPINVYDPTYGAPQPVGPVADNPAALIEQSGVYAFDRMEIGESLVLSFGGRYDTVRNRTEGVPGEQEDTQFSGNAAVIYRMENGVSPYYSYAESFLPADGFQVDANGDILDPKTGKQHEVGVKYQPEGTNSLFSFAYFDIEENNRPITGPMPNTYVPGGRIDISGVELEAIHRVDDLFFQAGYSYLSAENFDTPAGLKVESVPSQQASGWVTWRPGGELEGFKAGFGVRLVGENFDATNTLRTPAYTLLDAMIGYEVGPWDFVVNAANLTDKEYVTTALARGDAYYGQRRFLGLTVRREF